MKILEPKLRTIRRLWLAFGMAALCLLDVGPGVGQPQAPQRPADVTANSSVPHGATFQRYCLTCHTESQKQRGLVPIALDSLDVAKVEANPELWEKVILKMRAGVMPPAAAPKPDKASRDGLLNFLEASLDRMAATHPNPGRTETFHRLNRTEYRNAIRDLLDIDVDVSSLLPPDDISYGFDNIAGVLKFSPTLMDRYLVAAQRVSRLAVGTEQPAPNVDYFRIIDDLSQDVHLPGLPLGTRGGTLIRYVFPMDGEYEIRPRLARDLNESMPVYLATQELEVSIDGYRVGLFRLPGVQGQPATAPVTEAPDPQVPAISQIQTGIRATPQERAERARADEKWNLRVAVRSGQRDVAVSFINRTPALEETTRLPFLRPYPAGVNIPETRLGAHLRSVEILGPFIPSEGGESQSRKRIFSCNPGGSRSSEDVCARTILSKLARRAYRRPVTEADIATLLGFFGEGRKDGSFDDGIENALRRLLVSPDFLLRVERQPANAAPNSTYRLTDVELASRLSFFLWSSIPDDELLNAAEKKQLGTPEALARQVRRMLADPKADAFVNNFAGQWLFLRNLEAAIPVQSVFPDFDDTLRQAMRRETELFFASIVREDRSAFDLLRADYTFLNDRLAKHYGIPNINGSHFRRVELGKDNVRSGILGQGSILTVTSYPERTSPVKRGKWILENLLGTIPPPPLPNAGELPTTASNGTVLSMRQRMEAHRANPVCASCHAMMDPLGLPLENFDAMGRWRTLGEGSMAIDASGGMPGGASFDGPSGLRQGLLKSERFIPTITEKMMTYALGRGLEYYDAPAIRSIVRETAVGDHKLTSLIIGIVQSTPFRMRKAS
jgi:mono/diheme cytochrome c family protein